jgi:hypothetical protein
MMVDIAKKQMKPKYEGMPRNDRKSSASTAGRNVPKAVRESVARNVTV